MNEQGATGDNAALREILDRAAELPPEQRPAYLDQVCTGDATLRAEVESLLLALDSADDLLVNPTGAELPADSADPTQAQPGSRIGRYKLLQQIGEGGFGIVFMAEQEHPIRRMIALKVIKAGLDTRQVIARFEAERQALAVMDHPSIAKVLDAGSTDAGRPYFVMELVKGIPITEYCDQQQLSARHRLELFLQVCQAVQHAHTKGIIHRDLKPTNVLVTLNDGKPVPKIIDFGIAKAIVGPQLTDKTLFTNFAQIIGTPLYMSPEQAEMSGLMDVDTRSDVYSLGVLLYELLTGTTPFDKQRLAKAAYDEVRRIIREEEPPKPSTRLSTMLGETLTTVSAQRQTDAKRLGQLVRGELDWIVMRALEKDRTRRYETANGMARDVERYLSDQPVEACPPSRVYRLRKFARRNKAGIVTAAVFALVLVLATAISTWQAVRATRAEKQVVRERDQAMAETRRADEQAGIARSNAARADLETEKARVEAEKQTAVTRFLTGMLSAVSPEDGAPQQSRKDLTVLQVLDAASRQLDGESLESRPEVEIAVRDALNTTYRKIGQFDAAERHALAALELTKKIYGPRHPNVAGEMHGVCEILLKAGKPKEAEAVQHEAIKILQENFGDQHPGIAKHMRGLADALKAQNKLTAAEELYRATLVLELSGDAIPSFSSTKEDLAALLKAQGRPSDVKTFYRDAIATIREKGESAALANAITYFGKWLESKGEFAEAETLHREALAIRKKLFGEHRAEMATSLRGLGEALRGQGKSAEAVEMFREAVAIQRKLGADTTNLAMDIWYLAHELQTAGKFSEAEELHREGLAIWRKRYGEKTPQVGQILGELDKLLRAQGKTVEIESLWRESLEYWQKKLAAADTPEQRCETYLRMFQPLMNTGQFEQAKASCRKALELNPMGAEIAPALNDVAWELVTCIDLAHRDPPLAVALAGKAVELRPKNGNYWNTLGVARYRAADFRRTVADLDKSVELGNGGESADFFFLAMAHQHLGDPAAARRWYEKGILWMDQHAPQSKELARFRAEAQETLNRTDRAAAATIPATVSK